MANFMYFEGPKYKKAPTDSPQFIGGVYKAKKMQSIEALKEKAEADMMSFMLKSDRATEQRESRRSKRK